MRQGLGSNVVACAVRAIANRGCLMAISCGRSGLSVLVVGGCLGAALTAAERTERFDKDPGWDGRNHRATVPKPRAVRQDFGYSKTAHAGGQPGEVGGFITPAAEPAYYGKKISARTFADPMSASGTLGRMDQT